MAHYVASEGSRRVESKAVGGGKYAQRWTNLVPTGTCHAVEEGKNLTACGVDVDVLVRFENQPWGRGIGMHWCRECESSVPL